MKILDMYSMLSLPNGKEISFSFSTYFENGNLVDFSDSRKKISQILSQKDGFFVTQKLYKKLLEQDYLFNFDSSSQILFNFNFLLNSDSKLIEDSNLIRYISNDFNLNYISRIKNFGFVELNNKILNLPKENLGNLYGLK